MRPKKPASGHGESSRDFNSVGDEGGFAPSLKSNDEAIETIIAAIERAGFVPGDQVATAPDPAASEFFESGQHVLGRSEQKRCKSPEQIVRLYEVWVDRRPIISIEDGVAEEDELGWRLITEALGKRIQLVGDAEKRVGIRAPGLAKYGYIATYLPLARLAGFGLRHQERYIILDLDMRARHGGKSSHVVFSAQREQEVVQVLKCALRQSAESFSSATMNSATGNRSSLDLGSP
jgi:hypothetical protein